MYWHESQQEPGKIDISFPADQAEALRAACSERGAEQALHGNPPHVFDASVVEIIDRNQGQPLVDLTITPGCFRNLPELIKQFAAHTTEALKQIEPGLNETERVQMQDRRRDLGITAGSVVLSEVEGAVAAYDSGFHGKLEAFMSSLNHEA